MARNLQWFKNRIGKRIYRDISGCVCKGCKEVDENGMIVSDEFHAEYLEMIDNDFEACGKKLNYRDIK